MARKLLNYTKAIWLAMRLTYGRVWNEELQNPTFVQKYWSWRLPPKTAWETAKQIWIED